ncbi:MAG: hypothetical protein ABW252_16540 [Polyangiales bacterium]
MNKRIQKKVAKRNGGVVRQHNVAAPKRKRAGAAPAHAEAGWQVRSRAAAARGPRALARELAREVAGVVQERAAGAVEQLKGKLAETEQRAEKLVAKVPVVGKRVAKKLHDVAGR